MKIKPFPETGANLNERDMTAEPVAPQPPDFQILEKRMMDNNSAMHDLLSRLGAVADKLKPITPTISNRPDLMRGEGVTGSFFYEQEQLEYRLGWLEDIVRHLETLV